MKSKNKQEALDKQRTLILLTLDYLVENYTGYLVFDDYDFSKEYYLEERIRVESYYNARRLDRMRAKLAALIKRIYFNKDILYPSYIEQKTGHRIGMYDDLWVRCNQIIQNGAIENIEEFNDIEYLNLLCTKDGNDTIDQQLLQTLMDVYKEHKAVPVESSELCTQTEIEDIICIEYKDVHPKTSKRQTHDFRFISSPNHKNWISLQGSGKGEFALTYLVVSVDGGTGSVYCARGENLNIKASWEDDETILIAISGKYETMQSYKKITTRTSTINIKYIEI